MMAMELQGAIDKKIGVKLSALDLMNGNSFAQVIRHVAEKADAAGGAIEATPPTVAINGDGGPHGGSLQQLLDFADNGQTAALLERLSDEEVAWAIDQLQSMPDAHP